MMFQRTNPSEQFPTPKDNNKPSTVTKCNNARFINSIFTFKSIPRYGTSLYGYCCSEASSDEASLLASSVLDSSVLDSSLLSGSDSAGSGGFTFKTTDALL